MDSPLYLSFSDKHLSIQTFYSQKMKVFAWKRRSQMQKTPGIEPSALKRRPRRAAFLMKLFLRIEGGRNTETASDSMGEQLCIYMTGLEISGQNSLRISISWVILH